VTRRLASRHAEELTQAERDITQRLGDQPFDFTAMAAVSNIYRAATTIRNHMENQVLAAYDISWAAFTVMWVLWIWGQQETRAIAAETGSTKGALTGVLKTLERRGFVSRFGHPDDGRLVLVQLSEKGETVIRELFPRFNRQESAVVSGLTPEEQQELAHLLRKVTAQVREADTSSAP
jgi:DNA-binding MarR family transcriptional regulator